uniref:SCP domain-containing protein n=1 Tax=Phasianus colchicus TaxID=9054 RepID=A0A669PNB4_PHACC
MRLWVMAAVVAAAALGAVAGHVSALPPIYDKGFIRECVRTHNVYRRNVEPAASNMRYMTWDAALARTARAWANKCIFDHNAYLNMRYHCHPHFMSVGENLWIGSYHIFHAKYAIKAWHDEVRNYNYSLQTCSKVCSHYTQVVWATSYKVGCAVHFCPRIHNLQGFNNVAHFVCDYGPAGNYPTKPYKAGRPCSGCSSDQCVGNLCVNAEREKLISYTNWYPDWDTQPPAPQPPAHTPTAGQLHSSCDHYCISVLILRPLFLVLSAVGVRLVQRWFPHSFMYV